MVAEDKRWRARSDLDTLERAEEVKRDKARHDAAMREANERRASLDRIQQRGEPRSGRARARRQPDRFGKLAKQRI